MSRALRYLFAALEHAQRASERTRAMVREAIARALAILAIQRVAA